ncbi:hypothetical protein [Pseudoruegeria sp. SK021]|uniref:hypothetical protein n=1 Tax=Pseudoruegeria sp. SK021 TaxID=1933035 RepID=UPI000A25F3E9|nr:hypothetical protein [Pseudoruegeria sp. SK021]OSP55202.1 hypothetical protein BV911_09245 [Pseudoruegeria sp. SK021]
MKFGEEIQAFGVVAALVMSGLSLYWQFFDLPEKLTIFSATGTYGGFHLTPRGVAQEVEFTVVNEGSEPVIVTRVDFSPNNLVPAPILIEGDFWDGRPFEINGNAIFSFRFLAIRDFNSNNTKEWREAKMGQRVRDPYRYVFDSIDHVAVPYDSLDSRLRENGRQVFQDEFESYSIQAVQDSLFSKGLTFDGDNHPVANFLSDYPMYVTYGGDCMVYMIHTLSVCASIELTTLKGNSFVSDYIGFGMRSNDLDK